MCARIALPSIRARIKHRSAPPREPILPTVRFRKLQSLLLAGLLPVGAQASPCPTGQTLADVIALGQCSIGDMSFDFTHPQLASLPLYFAGPFASSTALAPGAETIAFTPSTDADSVGFTLGGDFRAFGSPSSYSHGSGLYKVGNTIDASLAYLYVTPGAGRALTATSLALGGAQVSGDAAGNIAMVDFGGSTVLLTGDGITQLSASTDYGSGWTDPTPFSVFFRTWDLSADPNSQAGFGSVSLRFHEADIAAPVPEPASSALLLGGLGALTLMARRGRAARGAA